MRRGRGLRYCGSTRLGDHALAGLLFNQEHCQSRVSWAFRPYTAICMAKENPPNLAGQSRNSSSNIKPTMMAIATSSRLICPPPQYFFRRRRSHFIATTGARSNRRRCRLFVIGSLCRPSPERRHQRPAPGAATDASASASALVFLCTKRPKCRRGVLFASSAYLVLTRNSIGSATIA